MSNAEQERIEKAWEEAEIPIDCVLGENKWAVMKNGFRYGFLAGRADAMELPEVRAEELEEGNVYIGVMESGKCFVGVELFDPENGSEPYIQLHCFGHTEKTPAVFTSFRGPLPLGDA